MCRQQSVVLRPPVHGRAVGWAMGGDKTFGGYAGDLRMIISYFVSCGCTCGCEVLICLTHPLSLRTDREDLLGQCDLFYPNVWGIVQFDFEYDTSHRDITGGGSDIELIGSPFDVWTGLSKSFLVVATVLSTVV